MKAEHKQIVKKSVTEKLEKPNFGGISFKGCIAGWERNLNNNEFRRLTLQRVENNGEIAYFLEARNLLIGNVKKPEHQENKHIKVNIKSLATLNDPILEDWLSVHSDINEAKNGIVKIIADDLIKLEQERYMEQFLASL